MQRVRTAQGALTECWTLSLALTGPHMMGSHPVQSPYSPSYDIISSCVTDFITTSKCKSLKVEIRACGFSTTNLCYFQTWLYKIESFIRLMVTRDTGMPWNENDPWSQTTQLDCGLSSNTPFFVKSSAHHFRQQVVNGCFCFDCKFPCFKNSTRSWEGWSKWASVLFIKGLLCMQGCDTMIESIVLNWDTWA